MNLREIYFQPLDVVQVSGGTVPDSPQLDRTSFGISREG